MCLNKFLIIMLFGCKKKITISLNKMFIIIIFLCSFFSVTVINETQLRITNSIYLSKFRIKCLNITGTKDRTFSDSKLCQIFFFVLELCCWNCEQCVVSQVKMIFSDNNNFLLLLFGLFLSFVVRHAVERTPIKIFDDVSSC